MRRILFCGTLAAMICLGFVINGFCQSADRPDMKVGDRWSWQHTNALVNEKDFTRIEDVVGVSADEVRTRVRTKGQHGEGIATYTREWNPLDMNYAQFNPFFKEYSFPLSVGKQWDADVDKRVLSSGKHARFFVKGEVSAFEKVTVPAGTFDAYKINLEAQGASTDADASTGVTNITCWYAPAVKRYVKYESTFKRDGRVRSKGLYELLEYSLR